MEVMEVKSKQFLIPGFKNDSNMIRRQGTKPETGEAIGSCMRDTLNHTRCMISEVNCQERRKPATIGQLVMTLV